MHLTEIFPIRRKTPISHCKGESLRACSIISLSLNNKDCIAQRLMNCCLILVCRPVGRNFQRGVRSIRQGVWGPLKAPRGPWVFGAKSCNLAISRHFIQTFGKPCFPLLIFRFSSNFSPIRTFIITV